jgi:hypothetical protein
MAVGSYDDSSGDLVPLVEFWSGGASWAIQPALPPTGASSGVLYGVSCPSTNACMAVGEYQITSTSQNMPLAEAWNGSAWAPTSQQPQIPGTANDTTLRAVWCFAGSSCTAVGDYTVRTGGTSTLAESWNGTTWTDLQAPNPTDSSFNGFANVSCNPSAAGPPGTPCEIVGNSENGPLIESWDGMHWTTQTSSSPSATLMDVSCTAGNACTAVGSDSDPSTAGSIATFAERLDSTGWSTQPSPNAALGAFGDATNVGSSTATLQATVYPEGATVTSCYFKYGLTRDYGSTVPCPQTVGGGTSPVAVSADVSGLTPNTTYYFDVVAANLAGSEDGEAFGPGSFTTTTGGPVLQPTLTVSLAGSGGGSVTGSGISCPGTCSQSYTAGTVVTLSATPSAGSSFSGWSGRCSGTGPYQLTLSADTTITATFTKSPPPGVRPIIFVPGITGSYLRNASGGETWPQALRLLTCLSTYPSPAQAFCDGLVLSDNALALNGSTIPGDPSRDVDAANGLQRQLDGTLGGTLDDTLTKHVYDLTAANFERSGYQEVNPGDNAGLRSCAATLRCFVPVGVDWRMPAAFNATRVLAVIDRVIALTGTDRVNIVAHSQGGLITNALVHMPGSVGKIYRIVTLGTPWLGATKLLAALLYQEPCLASLFDFAYRGLNASICALDPGVAQRLLEDYPGAMELNPSQAFYAAAAYSPLLHVVNGRPASLTFNQGYQIVKNMLASSPLSRDTSLVDAATRWHDSVDYWAPADPTVHLVRMIGYDAGDNGYAKGTGTITAIDVSTGDLYYDTGDGTVPLVSADVYNPARHLDYRSAAHNLYFCGISHVALAQSPIVWEFAEPFLEGPDDYTHDDVKLGCPDGSDGTLQGVGLGNTGAARDRPAAAVSLGRGALIEVTGAGFAPGTLARLTVDSEPLLDGSIVTNQDGTFEGTFGVPTNARLGAHNIVATGRGPLGTKHRLARTVLLVPIPGFASRSAITGAVFGKTAALPLARICVRAYRRVRQGAAARWVPAGRTMTRRDGTFRLSGLRPGSYRVKFTDCTRNKRYTPVWYPAATTLSRAAVLRLVSGAERDMVTVVLPTAHRRRRVSKAATSARANDLPRFAPSTVSFAERWYSAPLDSAVGSVGGPASPS